MFHKALYALMLLMSMTSFGQSGDGLQPAIAIANMIRSNDIVLMGEEHGDKRHTRLFTDVLLETEIRHPELIDIVTVEVFSKYQNVIDKFLATGDESTLHGTTPMDEVIRGHKMDDEIKDNFINLYKQVYAINATRPDGKKIRILAIDHAPIADPHTSAMNWFAQHKDQAYPWMFGRDEVMSKAMLSIPQGKKVFGLIGSAHVQKSGVTHLSIGDKALNDSTWLGTRLVQSGRRVAVVVMNDPSNNCVDKIEAQLQNQPFIGPVLFDLNKSTLGNLEAFRCPGEFDPAVEVHEPANYFAKDHYDAYLYFPKER